MLNGSDALRAHAYCKALALQHLALPHDTCGEDYTPNAACSLMQFIAQCENANPPLDVSALRQAHAVFHAILADVAERQGAGEFICIESEARNGGALQKASEAIAAEVSKLERQLSGEELELL
jgi:hypothetical protein